MTKSREYKHTRRSFLKRSAFATAVLGLGIPGCTGESKKSIEVKPNETALGGDKNLYWGDIHNHNSIGYARGSLERAYDIASDHLDFFCFTGHSQWHDIPNEPIEVKKKHQEGFEVFRKNWPRVKKLANDYYSPGNFVSFIGYEWHSNKYGDVCIIFPGSEAELVYMDDIGKFQDFAKQYNALLLPHHPAYAEGRRGANWDVLDTEVSPVLEIYSEHGNAESDESLYPYIRHSMGGRYSKNTFQWLLNQGTKIGVTAGTDDHLGYPGAYGEGLTAVYTDDLSRESILESIKARRTYGVSHDRIKLDFRINNHWMGESLPSTTTRNISFGVEGKDAIDRVEILRNNEVITRYQPVDRPVNESSWNRPVMLRIEYGWGPWGDLDMARICDWLFDVRVDNGEILEVTPCFQSGPYVEDRRNLVNDITSNGCHVQSYTSRTQAFQEVGPINSIVLKMNASPQTRLSIKMKQPKEMSINKRLSELNETSHVAFTGPFTMESMLIHRPVFESHYKTHFEFTDELNSDQLTWYYARVVQKNGSLAWSSPIWIG